jgi:hypothetical protein
MKRLAFGSPLQASDFPRWVTEALREIESASAEDVEATLSEFSYTGALTEVRTFDAATATATDLRNVLATLISDIKKRGQKRSYGS